MEENMHALIMLIVCVVTTSFTLGYIFFSKTPTEQPYSKVLMKRGECTKHNRISQSYRLHTVSSFKGNHKRYY